MNHPGHPGEVKAVAIATADDLRKNIRLALSKSKLKGRQADDVSLAEVRELLGAKPPTGHRRDLLIEHLHKLNDAWRCLHDRHLVALAKEMNIPMAEVYEVATFYHHFEVVKGNANGDGQAPGLTVRVCDGLACELAGAQALLARLPELLGDQDVRVVPVPCIGRCEQAPAAVVHQCPVPFATPQAVVSALNSGHVQQAPAKFATNFIASDFAGRSVPGAGATAESASPAFADYETYRANGGYALAAAVASGARDAESTIKAMEDSGLRGLGGAGFPAGRKWRIVRDQPTPN